MKHLVTILTALTLFSFSSRAHADNPGREFLMSCTYGVLAGTLVGAASLAFTDKPGDHLNHIARGASFGLYAGILLGLYVVYVVPGLDVPPDDQLPAMNQPSSNRHASNFPMFDIAPTVSRYGNVDGAQAQVMITRF